jgi:gamma-glutamylcyclotransferase (GGCT)/AIG2-like uncharacterized protein YtfP
MMGSSMTTARPPLFRLFVYGTLKRGFHNFDRYCRGVISIESAHTIGRLYLLPQGYPMLVVPPHHQLAVGSTDYLSDVDKQARAAADSLAVATAGGDWEQITGEVLSFIDPLTRLPPLDSLEDFQPGKPSLYHRALVPVCVGSVEPVWTYIAPAGKLPAGARRIGTIWP